MSGFSPPQKAELKEEKFLVVFFRTLQAIRLYEDNNELVRQCVSQLKAMAPGILVEGEFTILILDGGYHVQGRRFRYHRKTGKIVQELLDTFTDRGIHGLTLYSAFLEALADDILQFLRCLTQAFGMENPHEWLTRRLEELKVSWVELHDAERARELRDQTSDSCQRAKETYRRSIASVKDVSGKLARGRRAGIWKAKRVVQNLVDLVHEDEALSLGMSTIRDYDDYTYVHSVNVAVLSVCLGNRIGLSKNKLAHLGICGLFHDLGKVEIQSAIVKKDGPLDDREWLEIRKHPLGSMKQILKLNTSQEIKSRVYLAPLEHHLNYDLSGYPSLRFKKISLFGRILKLADVYDAITSPRAYHRFFRSPDQALRIMAEKAGQQFDPVLFKVFASMLGKYPMGTLLVLDTEEIGLVVGNSLLQPKTLPRVILLDKNEKGEFVRGEAVDIAETDPGSGLPKRKVLRSFHPAVCGIQPAEFILNTD